MSFLAAAINLIDIGTVLQVHIGIFRPCVLASTCAKDGGCPTFALVGPYGRVDVHMGKQCAALVVVAAIDSTSLGIPALVVDIRLEDVARGERLRSVCPTVDTPHLDGGIFRYVNHTTGCIALVVAAAIDRTNLSVQQVDDCREAVFLKTRIKGVNRSICPVAVIAHTQSVVAAGTEDLHTCKIALCIVRYVNEYVAAVLRIVAVSCTRMTFTSAKHSGDSVLFEQSGTYVYKGVVQIGHLRGAACIILSLILIHFLAVVIVAIAGAIDGFHVALSEFHIGGGLQKADVVKHLSLICTIVLYAFRKVIILISTVDDSAKVVSAIYDVTHPGEALLVGRILSIGLPAYIHLGVTQDVGIAGTAKGIVDAAVAQIDERIACDITFITAAVEVLCLCQGIIRLFGRVDV